MNDPAVWWLVFWLVTAVIFAVWGWAMLTIGRNRQ